MRKYICILMGFVLFYMITLINTDTYANVLNNTFINSGKYKQINTMIEKDMKKGKIPGLSVVVIKDGQEILKKGYGYSDIKSKTEVDSSTLFELGSVTKAYTGLAVLKLEEEGKLNLNDSVSKYIPWFNMRYEGEYKNNYINENVEIKLSNLLYHTSGIPFSTISDIPIDDSEEALANTIKIINGKKLDFYPGDKYQYATINYDILALIIEKVTGSSYEDYMKEYIFNPLGLKNTYFKNDTLDKLATGYKYEFLAPRAYESPVFRGNTAAGYCITNADDLGKWISIQIKNYDMSDEFKDLIDKSHIPDRTVSPAADGSSYAAGWSIYQSKDGKFSHGGNNPNYYSYISIIKDENFGLGVLANIDSEYVPLIGESIQNILFDEEVKDEVTDRFQLIDVSCVIIIIILIMLTIATVVKIILMILEIKKGARKFTNEKGHLIKSIVSFILIIASLASCIYIAPNIVFSGLSWSFIKVWASKSIFVAIVSIFIFIITFFLYYTLSNYTDKKDDMQLFLIGILSSISGFGNAFLIFIINESLNRDKEDLKKLLIYFALGLCIYIFGQKVVRTRLAKISNNIVYSKRKEMINKLLFIPYDRFEKIDDGKIQVVLNDDTELISDFATISINATTNTVTLICCLIYLGIINIYGVALSILIGMIAAGLYYWVGKISGKAWDEARNKKDIFFKLINSLINGFKELKINSLRSYEFKQDIIKSCNYYREKRQEGDLAFTKTYIIGELMFTIVIGAVAFIFPLVFKNMEKSKLSTYIFVFLYMSGPINVLLSFIPRIFQVKISWNRLNNFLEESLLLEEDIVSSQLAVDLEKDIAIELKDIEYEYKNNDGYNFKVGPINEEFNSGEIVFITGGNGGGKSTLVKVLLGLYPCDKGQILLNGKEISSGMLQDNFSAIFSDFYLFDKLYGLRLDNIEQKIKPYLKILKLEDKVNIVNGKFNTLKLSTGQRKRLALLISFIEDKPIYVFDEWAADQDPEFRKLFYDTFLPSLKKKNKCVIAITHDDRYFNLADRVLKVENGLIRGV